MSDAGSAPADPTGPAGPPGPAGSTSGGRAPDVPGAAPVRRPAPRGQRRAILVVLLLALLALVSAMPDWVRGAGSTALEERVPVAVAGTQAAPGVPAAALVLLSAGIAVALAGRIGRWVVVVVVLVAGLLQVASAASVLAAPEPVVRRAVAAATGVDTLAAPAQLTAWPWVAAGVGLLVVLAAGWLAVSSSRWVRAADRHDVVRPAPVAALEPDDDRAAWDALSRGHDPT